MRWKTLFNTLSKNTISNNDLHRIARQKGAYIDYAYMPAADVTDYPTSFHLENVRAAFRAREYFNVTTDFIRRAYQLYFEDGIC